MLLIPFFINGVTPLVVAISRLKTIEKEYGNTFLSTIYEALSHFEYYYIK